MSAFYIPYDLQLLEEELNLINPSYHNPVSARKALRMAMELVTSGKYSDIDQILPSVTKFIPSVDILCKKLAMWFVSSYNGKADLLLMAVNSLMKDCSNPNPVMRCLALKTLTQIPQVDFVEYSLQAVIRGLSDSSAYVRRAAVMSCLKLHKLNPVVIGDNDIIDLLYGLIRDKDPIVVLNCLQVLEELLHEEGGVIVNKNIAYYLLNHLDIFPEWGVSILLSFLEKYQAQEEDEVFDIMNLIDCNLQKNSASTVIKTLDFLLKLTQENDSLKKDVLIRAKEPLLHFLGAGNPEMTAVVIDYVEETYLPICKHELEQSYQLFLCRQKEPLFVKAKRMKILFKIVNDDNVQDILDELILYSSSDELGKTAIAAIGKIGTKSKSFHELAIKKLIQMLDVGTNSIKGDVFVILSSLDIKTLTSDMLLNLTEHVGNALSQETGESDTAVLASLFWLLGECGDSSDEIAYVVENYFEGFDLWHETDLCNAMLVACVKLVLKRPAEYQHIVGQLFEYCYKNCSIAVKETVSYYYNLLSKGSELALNVIL